MKFSKLFILLFTLSVFSSPNLFPQPQYLDEITKQYFDGPFSFEKQHDNKYLQKECFFQKKSNTIQLDSTSIVDSVIVNRINAHEEKYIYTYDSQNNLIVSVFKYWSVASYDFELFKITNTFNQNGCIAKKLSKRFINGNWYNAYQTTYIV